MDNAHEGHRKRLRETFLENGPGALHEHQLLELLLCFAIPRRDVNPLAHRLLNSYGSLEKVLAASADELMRFEGVGENAAVLLTLSGAIRAGRAKKPETGETLNTPEAASRYCAALLSGVRFETTYCISLNKRRRVLHADVIASGSLSENVIYPRVIAETAFRHGASGIILAHNHPSGSASPSGADVAATKTVCEALAGLGISMYDHIIVGDEETYSMLRNMLIPSGETEEAGALAADRED